MYSDFIGRAGDEIFNQLAKWQSMSAGALKLPVVLRSSIGSKYGAQHSQDWTGLVAHIPGLKVVYPATPYDAKGLLAASLASDDPVVFFESQRLYDTTELFRPEGVPADYYRVPIGVPDVKREGSDVTILTVGPSLYAAVAAADELERERGLSAEIIDARSLVPFDYDPVLASVKKTGRILLVSEASERGSFLQTLAANIGRFAFADLKAPPRVLGSPNWIVPGAEMESTYFPQAARHRRRRPRRVVRRIGLQSPRRPQLGRPGARAPRPLTGRPAGGGMAKLRRSGGQAPVSEDAALRVRAAWLYYNQGLTQKDVSDRLGVSRGTIIRILAEAIERGDVQIWINAREAECVDLAVRLEAALGLDEAVVVPVAEGDAGKAVGLALGQFLSEAVADGMTIGVGWGRTLTASLAGLRPVRHEGVRVVSLLGGVVEARMSNPLEFSWRMASQFGADCYLLVAPAIVDSPTTKRRLIDKCGLDKLYTLAAALDLAVVSVGDIDPQSTSLAATMIEPGELRELVGARRGRRRPLQLPRQGRASVPHALNRRVMSVDLEAIRNAGHVLIATGGAHRAAAIRAAVRRLGCNTLITDESAARALLAWRWRPAPRAAGRRPSPPIRDDAHPAATLANDRVPYSRSRKSAVRSVHHDHPCHRKRRPSRRSHRALSPRRGPRGARSRHQAIAFTDCVGSIVDRGLRERLHGRRARRHSCRDAHKPHVATHARQDFIDVNVTGDAGLLEARGRGRRLRLPMPRPAASDRRCRPRPVSPRRG